MKKYKVNIDREKPSSDEILSRRNFDDLMKQYKATGGSAAAKPFWKKGWFAGTVVAGVAVIVTTVVLLNHNAPGVQSTDPSVMNNTVNTRTPGNQNSGMITSNTATTKRCIAPPLKNLDVVFTHFSINSSKGGTLTYNSGSKLVFPKNAFVDENGAPVNGNVEVRYREFRDPVDIFVAGIPMTYDSAGKTWQFESAGMMEVNAFLNGKQVFLDKKKSVEIQFASEQSGGQFSVYLFDTTAGNWSFRCRDVVKPIEQNTMTPAQRMKWENDRKNAVAILDKQLHDELSIATKNNPVPAEPKAPLLRNKKKNRFTIACDPKEFPEILSYKDVIWMVDDAKEPFDTNVYHITWDEIAIAHAGDDSYNVVLKKGKTKLNIPVLPSYDANGYVNAKAEFDKKYEAYTVALNARKQAETTARSNYEMAMNSGGWNNPYSGLKINEELNGKVLRVFTINGFGVYNCDHADDGPQGVVLPTTLVDISGHKVFDNSLVYHVDRNRFSLMTYAGGNLMLHYNAVSSNLIWAVANGELYTADNGEFTRNAGKSSAQFVMTKVDRDFNDPEEMKAYFGIHAKR